MHLVGVVLVVFGAWMLLAVPVALVAGRFLRAGSERRPPTAAGQVPHDSFGTAA